MGEETTEATLQRLDEWYRLTSDEKVVRRLYEAADDLGHLRNLVKPERDSYLEWRINQIAGHIESLLGLYEPTAAELVARTHPGDDEAVAAALEQVATRHARLRRALGYGNAYMPAQFEAAA